MLRIRSLQTAMFSLCVGLALALSASARPDQGPGPRGFFLERQLEKLELPAQTRSAVDAVLAESRTSQEALHAQIREAHESMRALLDQETVDEAAVMQKADAIGALMTEQRKADLHTLIKVRSMLTPEQRAELDRQMQERRAHGWMGKRGGKGEGCEHGDKPDQAHTAPPGDVQG